MKTVWKYSWPDSSKTPNTEDQEYRPYYVPDGTASFQIPIGSVFLRAGIQAGYLVMWFNVETDSPVEERTFTLTGTGHKVDQDMSYMDSITMGPNSELVLHIWETNHKKQTL